MFSAFPPPVGAGFHPRPGVWVGGTRRFAFGCLYLVLLFHPISLVLPKETGWSPKEKRLWGGGAPVRFRDPPASPTRVGGATRPLRCPLRGRIESLAPGARGLGWRKSGPVKVFCPAFLQKSGRGPGAAPLAARRSARNSPMLKEAQEGVKGGTLAGGSPFAGGLSRPQPVRFTDAHSHPTPGGGWNPAPTRGLEERGKAGGGRREGSSRTPTPTAGGRRAVCRGIYCDIIPRPGGGRRNTVRPEVTVTAGRRGRRPLRGGCGAAGPAVDRRPGGGGTPHLRWAGRTRQHSWEGGGAVPR